MKNDFTIRRSLAHVLTLILFLVAGISEAKADNGGRPRLSDDGQLDAGGGSGCYGRENGRV